MFKHLFFIALFWLSASAFATQEFIVQTITVDVTDESALQAQEKAFSDAEIAAFQILLQKMVSPTDLSQIPPLTPEQIKNFITSFSVQDEKRSDVRYMANLQYRFDSNAIRNFLKSNAITYSEILVSPILIVPFMDPSHSEKIHQMWHKAWNQVDFKKYNLPFIAANPTSLPKEFSLGSNAAAEHLNILGQKHKAPHVALIHIRGEPNTDAPEESITSYLDVYPSALHKPDYTLEIIPFSILQHTDLAKLIEAIHQGLTEIEKSYLEQKQEDQSVTKETLELIVPTHTLSQWQQNLQKIQTIPGLMVHHIKSLSKSIAHIVVQVSDINHLTQQLLQKGFQVEPYRGYLILRMPDDITKSA